MMLEKKKAASSASHFRNLKGSHTPGYRNSQHPKGVKKVKQDLPPQGFGGHSQP